MLEILADRASNPDYNYIYNLFSQYRKDALGSRNDKQMFECLALLVKDYNNSGQGKTVL